MTDREKIIALARECGMAVSYGGNGYWDRSEQMIAFYHAAQKEALSNAKVSVPTDTMEQAFQQYHTMGYKKGRKDAIEQAALVCEEFEIEDYSNRVPKYQGGSECAVAIRQLIKG